MVHNKLWHNRGIWLAVGLLSGMVLGGLWPDSPVHAVATDRFDNFAICTGSVDGETEALYVLDFLTGDLKALVMSNQTGQFNAFFTRSIITDLNVKAEQNPRYLMVTGAGKIVPRGGQMPLAANSMLYIAELTSGKIAAYTIPWGGQVPGGAPQKASFILLDVEPFRNPQMIRDAGVGAKK